MEVSLSCLHLCFLQAEKIRVEIVEYLSKTFFEYGSEAIHIPAYKSHFDPFPTIMNGALVQSLYLPMPRTMA